MRDQDHGTTTERRAREVFDESVAALDAQTRSRLNRARQAAVASLEPRRGLARSSRPWNWISSSWTPAAVLASVALVAVLLWRMPPDVTAPAQQAGAEPEAIEAVEMLAAGDDLDLAADDPAFYAWLDLDATQPANGTG